MWSGALRAAKSKTILNLQYVKTELCNDEDFMRMIMQP